MDIRMFVYDVDGEREVDAMWWLTNVGISLQAFALAFRMYTNGCRANHEDERNELMRAFGNIAEKLEGISNYNYLCDETNNPPHVIADKNTQITVAFKPTSGCVLYRIMFAVKSVIVKHDAIPDATKEAPTVVPFSGGGFGM